MAQQVDKVHHNHIEVIVRKLSKLRDETLGITGSKDSKLSQLCDVCIKTPSTETYRIQEYTLPIYHALCALIEAEYFDK